MVGSGAPRSGARRGDRERFSSSRPAVAKAIKLAREMALLALQRAPRFNAALEGPSLIVVNRGGPRRAPAAVERPRRRSLRRRPPTRSTRHSTSPTGGRGRAWISPISTVEGRASIPQMAGAGNDCRPRRCRRRRRPEGRRVKIVLRARRGTPRTEGRTSSTVADGYARNFPRFRAGLAFARRNSGIQKQADADAPQP